MADHDYPPQSPLRTSAPQRPDSRASAQAVIRKWLGVFVPARDRYNEKNAADLLAALEAAGIRVVVVHEDQLAAALAPDPVPR